jgi:hypothetical protein
MNEVLGKALEPLCGLKTLKNHVTRALFGLKMHFNRSKTLKDSTSHERCDNVPRHGAR